MTAPAQAEGTSPDPWARVRLTLALLGVDPAGFGGLWLRARAGAPRDAVLAGLAAVLAPRRMRRMPPGIGDEQLYGGIDLGATLATGTRVALPGLLSTPGATLLLPMAERMEPGLAARLANALDTGAGHVIVALDEGVEAEEGLPAALADRLGLWLDLEGLGWQPDLALGVAAEGLGAARAALPSVRLDPARSAELVTLAAAMGIDSLRAPLLALRVARASAALAGRAEVAEDDIAVAAALVLGPRARRLPERDEAEEEPADAPPDQPPPDEGDDNAPDEERPEPGPAPIPREVLVEAMAALLPPGLLAQLRAGRAARAASGAGRGLRIRGNRRGRPLPSRPGKPDAGRRIDLPATLRTAAPWQPLRRAEAGTARGQALHVRGTDLRIRRTESLSDRLLIFVVDASGSTALARLAEAKGAVELLLAEAYAARDHVALVGFRERGAELLLPPTRSLVQTKRRLAGLAGGGGTPLAAGLRAGLEQALQARQRGMEPVLVLVTDGRANVALDGMADRPRAAEDALLMARHAAGAGVRALVIDTGDRPRPALAELAARMHATYLPLPRADAKRLSGSVAAALAAGA